MSARDDYPDLAHAAERGPCDERAALDEIERLTALVVALSSSWCDDNVDVLARLIEVDPTWRARDGDDADTAARVALAWMYGRSTMSDDLICTCAFLHVGSTVTSARNWNPDCAEHGTTSAWYNSTAQAENRRAQNARTRELQQMAREARMRAKATTHE